MQDEKIFKIIKFAFGVLHLPGFYRRGLHLAVKKMRIVRALNLCLTCTGLLLWKYYSTHTVDGDTSNNAMLPCKG